MRKDTVGLSLVVGLLALGCGSDGASPDTRDASGDVGDTGEVTSGCMQLTPSDLEALIFDGQDDVSTSYSLRLKSNIGVPAADYLVLQFINYNERIDNGAGTFPLDSAPNDNFGTCAECVAIWVDQADLNLPPGKFLFQSSGSIQLDVDPRTRRLIGRIVGVRFREIALDPETLSSTFVVGGDCAELTAPLEFDLTYVPPEWKCSAADYNSNNGCDCDCGTTDPDCYPTYDTPSAVPSDDCATGEVCYSDTCTSTCAVGADGGATMGCGTGELCTLETPDDICRAAVEVDAAALGEACTTYALYCAVASGLPGGVCSFDEAHLCRPLCASRADCTAGQHCYTVAGGYLGAGKGYCNDGPAPAWLCEAERWNDGATCDCDCGDGDPDCADPTRPISGCGGARCGADGACPE